MTKNTHTWIAALVLASLVFAGPGLAEDGNFDLGLRFDLGLGNGEPTNDIVGYSVFGHYRLNERWNLGFAVDHSPEFDFERTPDLLGFATPEVIDAKGSSTTLSGWIERVYRRPSGRSEWFWNAGLGFNTVDMKGHLRSADGWWHFRYHDRCRERGPGDARYRRQTLVRR